MKKEELLFWQNELIRVTDWIKFADKKIAFLSLYYSVILWSIFTYKNEILWFEYSFLYSFVLICFIGLFLLEWYFIFTAIFPKLNNVSKEDSLFYFWYTGSILHTDYMSKINVVTNKEIRKQLQEQVHTNSVIANRKIEAVQCSIKILPFLILVNLTLLFII